MKLSDEERAAAREAYVALGGLTNEDLSACRAVFDAEWKRVLRAEKRERDRARQQAGLPRS